MREYPLRAGSTIEFTPDGLKDIDPKPVFTLRWATREDRALFEDVCARENLTPFSSEEFRDEILQTLKRELTEDDFKAAKQRLDMFWEASDDYETAGLPDLEEGEERPAFDHPDEEFHVSTVNDVLEKSPRYRLMKSRNQNNYMPRKEVWFRILCGGWQNVDCDFAPSGKLIPADDMDMLINYFLAALPEKRSWAKVYVELVNKAASMQRLPSPQRKNSSSPPPLLETQKTSQESQDQPKSKTGSSPASAETSAVEIPVT